VGVISLERVKKLPSWQVFFIGTVSAPLLMGGLCLAVGRTPEHFTVGSYVGLILSGALLAGALIGWFVHYARQAVFGDDESPGGLNLLQYMAREIVCTVGKAIEQMRAWIEKVVMNVLKAVLILGIILYIGPLNLIGVLILLFLFLSIFSW